MGNCNASCLRVNNTDAGTFHLAPINPSSQSDPVENHQKNVKEDEKKTGKKEATREIADQSQHTVDSDESEDYDDNYAAEAQKRKHERGHKTISAEAYGIYNKKEYFKPKVIAKSAEQKERIIQRLEKAFMFSALDEKEKNIVVDAMLEKKFKATEDVIKQGDYGDHLYVVDSGQLDCFKKCKPNQADTYLKTYQPGESFGELALLYNCPRAATIKAKTDAVLWELDRETFNNIVKDSTVRRRERYEDLLQQVAILEGMDPYERSKIADVLKTVKYKANDYIIRQGEKGDKFYFIEEGRAIATKKDSPNGPEKEVYQYRDGDYFGELALRNNELRKASIIAKTNITLAVIDRDSFKRVLGPVDSLMEKQTKKYVGYN